MEKTMSIVKRTGKANDAGHQYETSTEQIVRTARLVVKLDHMDDASFSVEQIERAKEQLERELDKLALGAKALMPIAVKLIEGKPCRVTSDNPDTIRRARELAQYLCATISSVEEGKVMTSIVLAPREQHKS
jgi:hypothetical protein